jgi:uncharacterized protein YqgC (DUF456 family)
MDWIYFVSLVILLLAGVGATLLGLPGIWLMVLSVGLFGWLTGWDRIVGWPAVVAMTGLGLAAEAAEFFAGALGSRTVGGSKRSMVGAIVGALVGGIAFTFLLPIPVVGTLVGVCTGAFLGAGVLEWQKIGDVSHATKVGMGAAGGRLLGTLVKLAFAVVMLLVGMIVAVPVFEPGRAAPPQPAPAPTTLPSSNTN